MIKTIWSRQKFLNYFIHWSVFNRHVKITEVLSSSWSWWSWLASPLWVYWCRRYWSFLLNSYYRRRSRCNSWRYGCLHRFLQRQFHFAFQFLHNRLIWSCFNIIWLIYYSTTSFNLLIINHSTTWTSLCNSLYLIIYKPWYRIAQIFGRINIITFKNRIWFNLFISCYHLVVFIVIIIIEC